MKLTKIWQRVISDKAAKEMQLSPLCPCTGTVTHLDPYAPADYFCALCPALFLQRPNVVDHVWNHLKLIIIKKIHLNSHLLAKSVSSCFSLIYIFICQVTYSRGDSELALLQSFIQAITFHQSSNSSKVKPFR